MSRGPRSTPSLIPGNDRRFSGMLLSPLPFAPGKPLTQKYPSNSSRLNREYSQALPERTRTRSPSARRAAAAIPTASRAPRRAAVRGRLPHPGRQGEAPAPGAAAIRDLDPDRTVPGPDRDRDSLTRTGRAAMPHAVAENLAHQQDSGIPSRVPGTEHPVYERAGDPSRSARPASVTLSRTASPVISTRIPGRPRPGKSRGLPGGHTGMHARLGGPRQGRIAAPLETLEPA